MPDVCVHGGRDDGGLSVCLYAESVQLFKESSVVLLSLAVFQTGDGVFLFRNFVSSAKFDTVAGQGLTIAL